MAGILNIYCNNYQVTEVIIIKFKIDQNAGHLSYGVIQQQLFEHISNNSLLSDSGLSVKIGHLGMTDCDILITTWETSCLPKKWKKFSKYHKLIVVGSEWNLKVFQEAGINNVICIPFGIDKEYYQTVINTVNDKKSFTFFANNQLRKGFDVLENLWVEQYEKFDGFVLNIYGRNINPIKLTPCDSSIVGNYKITKFLENALLYEPLVRLSNEEIIEIYKNTHTLLLPSRSEGFGLTVLEAMCCGASVVIPGYSSTAEFDYINCYKFIGEEINEKGAELGFGLNGKWWNPSIDSLIKCMLQTIEDKSLSQDAIVARRKLIFSKYSWDIFIKRLLNALDGGDSNYINFGNEKRKKLGWSRIFVNKVIFKINRNIYRFIALI